MRSASDAYLSQDYASAEAYAQLALEIRRTEEASLILADVYLDGSEDLDAALSTLYLGYTSTGSELIAERIESLKTQKRTLVGDEGSILIAGQEVSLNSTALSLRGQGLTSEDIEALTALRGLMGLDLSNNAISTFEPLAELHRLNSLDLSGNPVSDLTPLSSLTSLTVLYLDGCQLPDITPLLSMTSLRSLSLMDAGYTPGQLAALRQALPLCEIHVDETAPDAGEGTGEADEENDT